jgi:hypothetical protein
MVDESAKLSIQTMVERNMEMLKESEKQYRSIIKGDYDSRLKKSLENIKTVCDEIENHGGRIYVGRVGKLCKEQFGGPAAQSIRNQPDTLKRYVDLRSAEQVLPARISRKGNGIQISDPKTRAYVLLLEEQGRDYEEQIRILKRLIESVTPVEIDKLIAEAASTGNLLALPPVFTEPGNKEASGVSLSEPARRALEKITSESHLKRFRLKLYKGMVVDEMMSRFLDKAEYQALLNILAA